MTRPFDPSLIPEPESPAAYTVTELNALARRLLERNFSSLWVRGEASNVSYHPSGHLYFTLKDASSQIGAVMWRDNVAGLKFRLEPGMEILAFGDVTLYSRWGRYQFVARSLEPRGVGALEVAFRQLCERLEKEGLFDEAAKKPLPMLPSRIALVTSRAGAAVRDMAKSIFDRFPRAHVSVMGVQVQGERAAGEIAEAVRLRDASGKFDVIVVGRGGGSLEDLWAFNEEAVARAIYECGTPLVSAVGHERDVTVSDLVADARAMTPTEVGRLVVADETELLAALDRLRAQLVSSLRRRAEKARGELALAWQHPVFVRPRLILEALVERLEDMRKRTADALSALIEARKSRLRMACVALESLSPLGVLARGYSVTRAEDGSILTDSGDAAPGEEIDTILKKGRIKSTVKAVCLSERDSNGQKGEEADL